MVTGGFNVTPRYTTTSTENATNCQKETENENCLLRLIQRHYTINVKVKSEEEIESEKWLVRNLIHFNRWFSMPAAFIIQFCCGSLYAWSIFNKPIDQLIYGTNANIAPIIFYVAIGFYGCAAGLAGPWLEQKGPKYTCLIAANSVLVGNLIAALGLHLKLISLVFLGYGVFVGAGFGICYISPVSALQKWFPDMRGLGAGFATCGFGAGTIVIAKIQIPLIEGLGLPLTFVALGVIFYILIITAALVLRTPPPDYIPGKGCNSSSFSEKLPYKEATETTAIELNKATTVAGNSSSDGPSLIEALTSSEFRIMVIMFVGDIACGLVLAARLANVIIDIFGKTPEEAATVVSVNGAVNFVGRLLFSIISDYIGRKYCFIVMLTSQVLVLGFFSTMTNGKMFITFWISTAILTATYGAAFGVIPAFLTDKFGPTNIGACHGIFISVWAALGVTGGLIFTLIFNSLIASGYELTDAILYNANAWWLFGVACIGWVAIHFVKPTLVDQRFKRCIKKLCTNIFCWN